MCSFKKKIRIVTHHRIHAWCVSEHAHSFNQIFLSYSKKYNVIEVKLKVLFYLVENQSIPLEVLIAANFIKCHKFNFELLIKNSLM